MKVEGERINDIEMKLKIELDQNHMKKMLMAMVDQRLGALETSSASMMQMQSASLESLREINQKLATNSMPNQLSAAEKDRRMANYAKTLE